MVLTRYIQLNFHDKEDVVVAPFLKIELDRVTLLLQLPSGRLAHNRNFSRTRSCREHSVPVCPGIIAQWTIGAIRGMPTDSAAQNLAEQVYPASMIIREPALEKDSPKDYARRIRFLTHLLRSVNSLCLSSPVNSAESSKEASQALDLKSVRQKNSQCRFPV